MLNEHNELKQRFEDYKKTKKPDINFAEEDRNIAEERNKKLEQVIDKLERHLRLLQSSVISSG